MENIMELILAPFTISIIIITFPDEWLTNSPPLNKTRRILFVWVFSIALQFVFGLEQNGIGKVGFNFLSDEFISSKELFQSGEINMDASDKILEKREVRFEPDEGKGYSLNQQTLHTIQHKGDTASGGIPEKKVKKRKVKRKQTTTIKPNTSSVNLVSTRANSEKNFKPHQDSVSGNSSKAISGRNINNLNINHEFYKCGHANKKNGFSGPPQKNNSRSTAMINRKNVKRVYKKHSKNRKRQAQVMNGRAISTRVVQIKNRKPRKVYVKRKPKKATSVAQNSTAMNAASPKRFRREANEEVVGSEENLEKGVRQQPYPFRPPGRLQFPPQPIIHRGNQQNQQMSKNGYMPFRQPPQLYPLHFHIPLLSDYPQPPPTDEELIAAASLYAPVTFVSPLTREQNAFAAREIHP